MTDFSLIWRSEAASANHKLVLLAIGYFSRKDGICYARRSTISKVTGLSLSTVHKIIPELAEAKVIRIEKQYGKGGNQAISQITVTLSGEIRTDAQDWDLDPACFPNEKSPPRHPDNGKQSQGISARRVRGVETPESAVEDTLIDRLIDKRILGADAPGTDSEVISPERLSMNAYNEMAERCDLAKARMTNQRMGKIHARLKEFGADSWAKALEAIERSKFLRGLAKTDRKWKADLDFMLQPSKYVRLLEGGYDQDIPLAPPPPKDRAAALQAMLRSDLRFARGQVSLWMNDRAQWPTDAGPQPDQLGCVVDARVLREFGLGAIPPVHVPAHMDVHAIAWDAQQGDADEVVD